MIARALDVATGSVYTTLKYHGGIAPTPRRPRTGHLDAAERETISRGLSARISLRAIAVELDRSPSTISREVERNGGRDAYRALDAQERADERRRRPKQLLLERNPRLREHVVEKLELEWSPEQIARRLPLDHADDPDMRISHETIYRGVYTSRWKLIPKHPAETALRTRRPIRKNKHHSAKGQWRSQIIGARPIEERPAEAETRSATGYLEGDLILGSKISQVATLVDRKTRFLTMVQLADRRTVTVVDALI
ncbi:IS30 family transposase, partial [Nocardia sp. SYP-A9097]|uniref:IS30 family transposase n=1 Tax=Nocardia sp. SYP-A9097 TaxID=2663237 RepID=UPI001890F7E9